MNKELTKKQQVLISKYENPKKNKLKFDQKKDMYLKQTDKNYKDGDRN